MDIGVVVLVVMAQRVEDGARFLRGGGVIEIDERMPVDLLVENREILPQGLQSIVLAAICAHHNLLHVLPRANVFAARDKALMLQRRLRGAQNCSRFGMQSVARRP